VQHDALSVCTATPQKNITASIGRNEAGGSCYWEEQLSGCVWWPSLLSYVNTYWAWPDGFKGGDVQCIMAKALEQQLFSLPSLGHSKGKVAAAVASCVVLCDSSRHPRAQGIGLLKPWAEGMHSIPAERGQQCPGGITTRTVSGTKQHCGDSALNLFGCCRSQPSRSQPAECTLNLLAASTGGATA